MKALFHYITLRWTCTSFLLYWLSFSDLGDLILSFLSDELSAFHGRMSPVMGATFPPGHASFPLVMRTLSSPLGKPTLWQVFELSFFTRQNFLVQLPYSFQPIVHSFRPIRGAFFMPFPTWQKNCLFPSSPLIELFHPWQLRIESVPEIPRPFQPINRAVPSLPNVYRSCPIPSNRLLELSHPFQPFIRAVPSLPTVY